MPLKTWPTISRESSDILRLFTAPDAIRFQTSLKAMLQRSLESAPICSLDLEFNPERPTVLGLSDGVLHISVSWDAGRPYLIELLRVHPDIYWIGHFLISADVQVLAKEGIALQRQNVTDSAIWHWLTNMHLCKGTGKTEDGHDKRGKGYMNLWSYASLNTSYRNWKECIGEENGCDGTRPCPDHSPFWYNTCMYTDTKVWMADGTWKNIQEIETGELVKSVLNGGLVDRPVIRRTLTKGSVNWLAIKSWGEHMANHKGYGIICTDDHPWFVLGRGYVNANKLKPNDRVYLPREGHEELIHGTLLGDAYVGPKGHISISQVNRGWAEAKAVCLKGNLKDVEFPSYWDKAKLRKMYGFTRAIGPHWRKKFYRGKQKLWVPPNSAAALAVFYGDDGCLQRKGSLLRDDSIKITYQARFACHAFPNKEKVRQWFAKKYGLASVGNVAVVILSHLPSMKFFEEIAPWLHPSMEYKLPPEFKGRYNGWMEKQVPQVGEIRSVQKARLPRNGKNKNTQHCLEISETHCFFTRAGLVKNCDAAAVIVGLPNVVRKARLWRVAHLHDLHRDLLWSFQEMSNYGILVDMPYVDTLREELVADKDRIARMLPFNPASPQQVVQHFKKKGIVLDDAQEQTVRDTVEDGETDEELELLLEFKELGNGPDRWFKRQYRDKHGWWKGFVDAYDRIHCRLGIWTSSGRMLAADPNLTNVSKRRVNRHRCVCEHSVEEHIELDGKRSCVKCKCAAFKPVNVGKRLRRAFIASPGTILVDADYKNGENVVFLYLSGYTPPEEDFHTWMAKMIGIGDDHPFAMKEGSAREAAKTVVHGSGDYGEGLRLMTDAELRTAKVKKEVDFGARIVVPEWRFRGKVATFTGVNLARRAFGSATLENRRISLDIVRRYFDRFPDVRKLQIRISNQIEREGGVRPPSGYFTRLTGDDEDCIKSGLAIFGSQPIAHLLKLAIVDTQQRFSERRTSRYRPLLPIHDELLGEWPEDEDPVEGCRLVKAAMERELPEMLGMFIKSEPAYSKPENGPSNWRDMVKI